MLVQAIPESQSYLTKRRGYYRSLTLGSVDLLLIQDQIFLNTLNIAIKSPT